MSTPALAAILHEPHGDFTLERVMLGELRPDEVLVRIEAAGMCHTDLMARAMLKPPMVLGHEGAGTIVEVGADVRSLRAGDAVTLSYPSCGSCSGCRRRQPHLCAAHMELAFGAQRLDGTQTIELGGRTISSAFFQQSSFATHAIAPASSVVRDEVGVPAPLRAALSCGVQTGAGAVIETFGLRPGESLAVFGAGTVGLSAVMAARLCGADCIVAVDVEPARLEMARQLGASEALDARRTDLVDAIRSLTNGGIDYALETSAQADALDAAIAVLSNGGTCGMVTAPHFGQKYPFSPTEIFKRATTLCGVIQGSAVPQSFIPKLMQWWRAGRFPYDQIVTTYPFERINAAVRDVEHGRAIKAVLAMDADAQGQSHVR